MIRKINISEKDKKSILEHSCPKDPSLQEENFSSVVVNKPWGYEYLMFQNKEISIWMLYIKRGFSTSNHCHPNKKTSLLLLSGEAQCSTLNEKFNLKEKDGLIFDKGVFHKTEAMSENGIFVLETETPSDKTDLFRLEDNYKRVMKTYTDKKNVTNKIYNYHYLFLEDKNNSTNRFGKHKFLVRTFDNEQLLLKEVNSLEADSIIILDGEIEINGEIFSRADLILIEDLKKCKILSPVRILLIFQIKNLIKLSDFVISFLEKEGIKDVFLVSGGNLMHLLESVRVNKNMHYLCNHHEQASAMAADLIQK